MTDDYRQRCADAAMNAWSQHAVLCSHSQIIPVGHLVDAVLAVRDEELERAIAHDRQPYPTQWAYDQACAALEKHRERADVAEAEAARLRAGEADEPAAENTWLTPAQWIRRWNDATPEQRLARAAQILKDSTAAEHCFISAHDGMQAELDTAIATLTRMHDDPEMRAKLLELRIGLEGEAFVAVRRADLDLVMNGAGDATRTANYPAACQRIRDALEEGQHA